MTAGATTEFGGRPVPFQGRGKNKSQEVGYYMSFYRCPCDAHPFVQWGRVTVEHRNWCPVQLMKTR